jgi:hypothetical protein
MKKLKIFLTGLVIGGLLGLWSGVNIGKGQPIYANPLSDPRVSGKLKETGEEMVRQSGEALEKTGKALKDNTEEAPRQ